MTNMTNLERVQALIEEELGNFRLFADLPASELETMAQRLAKTVSPFVEADVAETVIRRAA